MFFTWRKLNAGTCFGLILGPVSVSIIGLLWHLASIKEGPCLSSHHSSTLDPQRPPYKHQLRRLQLNKPQLSHPCLNKLQLSKPQLNFLRLNTPQLANKFISFNQWLSTSISQHSTLFLDFFGIPPQQTKPDCVSSFSLVSTTQVFNLDPLISTFHPRSTHPNVKPIAPLLHQWPPLHPTRFPGCAPPDASKSVGYHQLLF